MENEAAAGNGHEIQTELTRDLGLTSALAIGVGTMIAAGIFTLSGLAVKEVGSAAVASFLLAAVVAAPGETLTDEELVEHCRGRIGGYKIPRRYVFLEELPKSAMNKILKNELRRAYGEGSRADEQR